LVRHYWRGLWRDLKIKIKVAAIRARQMPMISQAQFGVVASGTGFAWADGDCHAALAMTSGVALVLKVNTASSPDTGLVILTPQK